MKKTLLSLLLVIQSSFIFANTCAENMGLIHRDGKTEVDIFLGYYNNEGKYIDTTMNQHMYWTLEQFLVRKCNQTALCGFRKIVPNDPNVTALYTKRVNDRHGPREVIVRIYQATRKETGGLKDPAQKAWSDKIEDIFHDRVRNGEVVFYAGHSRYGGGPDFHPPVLNASKLHPSKTYYTSKKPGLKGLLENLRGSDLRIYGSFSCESVAHFSQKIKSANPDVTFFGNVRTPTYIENNNVMLWSLVSVIDGNCTFGENISLRKLPGKMIP